MSVGIVANTDIMRHGYLFCINAIIIGTALIVTSFYSSFVTLVICSGFIGLFGGAQVGLFNVSLREVVEEGEFASAFGLHLIFQGITFSPTPSLFGEWSYGAHH